MTIKDLGDAKGDLNGSKRTPKKGVVVRTAQWVMLLGSYYAISFGRMNMLNDFYLPEDIV